LIEQDGADLGERLANIFKNLFEQDFKKVLILDSDTPNLPLIFEDVPWSTSRVTELTMNKAKSSGLIVSP